LNKDDLRGEPKLEIEINQHHSLFAWVSTIIKNTEQQSNEIVEYHLIGASLQQRFKKIPIPNHPAPAGDKQTERMGDFSISNLVYHVTAAPSRNVLQKCADNLKVGLHPILLVPHEQENKARVLAQDEGIDQQLTIIAIESFIALNIIELATDEKKDFFSVLKEIVDIYNTRLSAVETDLSLQIEVR
jgi:hypothetical protein